MTGSELRTAGGERASELALAAAPGSASVERLRTLAAHPVVLPLAVLTTTWAVMLPSLRWHLTPDGVAYLSIAAHLLEGHPGALNPYWSPLWSWLATPVLAVGLAPTVAAKVVGLGAAVAVMVALDRWLVTVEVSVPTRRVALLGLVPFVLQGAVTWVSPDLLVAVPVLALARRVATGEWSHSDRAAVTTGLVAGTAYLAKLYALPIVIVVLAVTVVVALVRGVPYAPRRSLALLGSLVLVVGAWTVALSADRDGWTPGTAASVNTEVLDRDSRGSLLLHAGPFPPPHDAAVTAWEDPSELGRPSLPGGGAEEVDDASDRDAAATGPAAWGERLLALWPNVADNLWSVAGAAGAVWPLVLFAGLGPVLARGRVRARVTVAFAVAGVWVGGLLPLVVHERYLWPAALLLVPAAAVTAERWRSWRRVAALAVLLVVWLPTAWSALEEHGAYGRSSAGLATRLVELGVEQGDRLATDRAWNIATMTCFHVGCRSHGQLAGDQEDAAHLRAQDVRWLLWWNDDAEPPVPTVEVGPVALRDDYRGRLLLVR